MRGNRKLYEDPISSFRQRRLECLAFVGGHTDTGVRRLSAGQLIAARSAWASGWLVNSYSNFYKDCRILNQRVRAWRDFAGCGEWSIEFAKVGVLKTESRDGEGRQGGKAPVVGSNTNGNQWFKTNRPSDQVVSG